MKFFPLLLVFLLVKQYCFAQIEYALFKFNSSADAIEVK